MPATGSCFRTVLVIFKREKGLYRGRLKHKRMLTYFVLGTAM